MKTTDFEKAIEALGVKDLTVTKYSYAARGQVGAVYGQLGESTFVMWDANGRGFTITLNYELEGIRPPRYPELMDYRRDSGFDLTFE